MSEFKEYQRTQKAELRPVIEEDINQYALDRILTIGHYLDQPEISISEADRKNGSPKIGDMIARNPKNHNDQWLVSKAYFEDNFKLPEN